jgi:sialidase-1
MIYLYVVLISFFFNLVSDNAALEISPFVHQKVFNYPVLKGKVNNPLIRIEVDNSSKGKTVTRFKINLGKTTLSNLKSVRVFYTGSRKTFSDSVQFGESMNIEKLIRLEGIQVLNSDKNYFWISCELSDQVDLLSKVHTSLDYVEIDNQKLIPFNHSTNNEFRLGVAIRQKGEANVHTYRIPGLTTTKSGSLLAVYDVRRDSGRDLQGHMDIGISRSVDGGANWEPMRIAIDMAEWGGLPQKFNGVSDACILVDDNSGDIYVAGLWMHGVINEEGIWQENLTDESEIWNHQWRNKGSQPGLGVKETSQFLIVKSTDDGITWGEPMNLTSMCKDPKWWLWAPAPGHGITLEDGTLVFPTQGRDENGLPFSNITYSKDEGKIWKTSKAAYQNTTECMAVQLNDGSIMLNMRNNFNRYEKGKKNGRAIAVTSDLGNTWTEHETSCSALIEPVCMASIHKHEFIDDLGHKKNMLFFSNPNSKYTRDKQTIKVSFDDGLTWPSNYWITLDEGRGAGYSCLTSIDKNTIGILYEGSQAQMTFQKVNISNIIKIL